MPIKPKQKPDNTPKAIVDCHDLIQWIIPKLDDFPRKRRFTLGDRIETSLLDVLDALNDAAFSQNKYDALLLARQRLQRIIHLWRLAYELQAIGIKSYENGSKQLIDLGKQVSGWLKHSRK